MRTKPVKELPLFLFFVFFSMLLLVSVKAQSNSIWKAPANTKKIKNPLAKIVSASKKGKILFETNCVVCHGEKGKGDGMAAAALNPKPTDLSSDRVKKETDGELFWKMGNGKGNMPPWQSALTKTQRWQLVNYVRTLQSNKK